MSKKIGFPDGDQTGVARTRYRMRVRSPPGEPIFSTIKAFLMILEESVEFSQFFWIFKAIFADFFDDFIKKKH